MDVKQTGYPPPYSAEPPYPQQQQAGPYPGTCYQAGAAPNQQYTQQQVYPSTTGVVMSSHHPQVCVQPVMGTTQVIVVGGCPSCRVGVLEDDYTCCGILCAILFFPIGILCCLAMKQRRCPNCGAIFG